MLDIRRLAATLEGQDDGKHEEPHDALLRSKRELPEVCRIRMLARVSKRSVPSRDIYLFDCPCLSLVGSILGGARNIP